MLSSWQSKYLSPLLFGIFFLAAWQLTVEIFDVKPYLLPSPFQVFQEVLSSKYYLHHCAITLIEASAGLFLAVVMGFLLGALMSFSSISKNIILPYAIASQAVPIIAVAPLLILWFGSGSLSKIAMAGLLCFFPMLVSTYRGLSDVSSQQMLLMKVYAASQWQIFTKLKLPASVPHLLTGMRTSAALAVIGAIVAEYAGADAGLGYVIMQSTYRLETLTLFAGIVYAAMGGLFLFWIIVVLDKLVNSRFYSREGV